MKNFQSMLLVTLLAFTGGILSAQKKSDINVTGTWEFIAPAAPQEYSTGDLVISKEGKELSGEIVFGEQYKVPLHEVKLADNVLTFKAYIEGEGIEVSNTVTKDEMKGEVKYSEGTLELTAKRKKE